MENGISASFKLDDENKENQKVSPIEGKSHHNKKPLGNALKNGITPANPDLLYNVVSSKNSGRQVLFFCMDLHV